MNPNVRRVLLLVGFLAYEVVVIETPNSMWFAIPGFLIGGALGWDLVDWWNERVRQRHLRSLAMSEMNGQEHHEHRRAAQKKLGIPTHCAFCGKPREGLASVSRGEEMRYVCHSDNRDCYRQVTVYHQPFPDGWQLNL